jgi:arabinosyltransferase
MQALGAGVIVPQFVAGQDRWWAPHSGRLPQAPTELPYRAPLDHILDLERGIGRKKDVKVFGPDIPYREYSFLENERMPAHIREREVLIELCSAEDSCADGSQAAVVQNGSIRLKAGLDDKQLQRTLGKVALEYKVLKFKSIDGVFSQHKSDKDAEKFARRTSLMPSIWCCVQPQPGKPGHVWYDLWWDVVPHIDVHNRKWNEPWHIVTGP